MQIKIDLIETSIAFMSGFVKHLLNSLNHMRILMINALEILENEVEVYSAQ